MERAAEGDGRVGGLQRFAVAPEVEQDLRQVVPVDGRMPEPGARAVPDLRAARRESGGAGR